ncbi:hypothetical protein CEXT_151231 [Caerostris extrusa]|uniref:Uncharacterized protein n=1 Tax=Caerostris extrusa TaxID=172846 RepID=A0AAV4NIP2_CAEEX|nr:hypothetical protein CEXT_151231 [Caerostris extrusa]
MFPNVHLNLCEDGSLRGSWHSEGKLRVIHTSSIDQNVLDAVDVKPSSNVRGGIAAAGGSRKVYTMFYKAMPNTHIITKGYSHCFPQTILHVCMVIFYQCAQDAHLPSYVLFTDKAHFTLDGVFNQHIEHLWANCMLSNIPVNVWFCRRLLIGPYHL